MDSRAWSDSDVSPENLLKLTKGFIDLLILASGYQSSGRLAHWDSTNIKKAFQWALFLENSSTLEKERTTCLFAHLLTGTLTLAEVQRAFRCLRCSDDSQELVEAINSDLSEIKCNLLFPQGLGHLSLVTLGRAKVLMLKHLVNTLPLRGSHFKALVTAIVETDVDGLKRIDDHCLDVYLENLSYHVSNTILTWKNCCTEGSMFASSTQSRDAESSSGSDFTKFSVEELGKRHLQLSCIAAAENGLDVVSKITRKNNWIEVETTVCGDQITNETTSMCDERPIEPLTWNHWKSRSLSYLLNKRTVRLASGAKLFFSAPKHQWINVIDRLHISHYSDEDICEKIEILLLGRIVHRWSSLIKILMSNSYESVTIWKLYHEVENLPLRRFQNLFSKRHLNPEENGLLEYLEGFLGNHIHQLWRLSPVLPAMAIPCRSPLFKLYIIELESQIRGDSSAIR